MKRILCILLTAIMLLSVGCASTTDDGGADTTQKSGETAADGVTETEAISYTPDFEVIDWEGKEFIFACTSANYDGGYYETIDIYVEAQDGEVFNDAVYTRNKNVEERYNIKIVENKYDNVASTIRNSVNAGDDICNAIFSMAGEGIPHAQEGLLIDLNTMPNMNFDQPWWDINVKNDLSIGGKTYLMTGDISVMDDNCTVLFFFNKSLINTYSLANPYDLLSSNKWTFDEYQNMVKSVSADLNGDGTFDDKDQYGNVMAYHNVQYMAHGSGVRYFELDSKGYPAPVFMNDYTVNVFDKISGLFFDTSVCLFFNNLRDPSGGNSYAYGRQLFANDQILFCLSQPLIFNEFRNMESEFGILPTPKFDEKQDRYYSSVDVACNFLTIPKTAADLDFTGYILEGFAAESKNVVTPAYYDIMLKRKYTRDDESAEVLELIAVSRLYDLGVFYNWGGINAIITNAIQNQNTDITSAYDKIAPAIDTAIQKTFEAYESVG